MIYTVTKANYAEILPKLNHSTDVMTDVANAINADKVVTVNEKNISYKGWHGSDYVILDPTTGVGAYLIGGGFNGGDITLLTGLQKFFNFLVGEILSKAY